MVLAFRIVLCLGFSFDMKARYIGMGPAFFYTLICGALSDDFGRKPLIFFPLIGSIISKLVYLLGTIFFGSLPIEFFYLGTAWDIFGGIPIYYMGVYGYGSSSASQPQRATTLARYDGVEQASVMLGTAVSPLVFELSGYSGSFVTGLIGNIAALVALVYFAPEPVIKKKLEEVKSQPKKGITFYLTRFVVTPIKEMLTCLLKRRESILRTFLLLAFFNYGIYLFILQGREIAYLYMLRKFPGFTGSDHAMFTVIMKCGTLVSLFVIIPYFSGRLQVHETILLSVMCWFTASSRFAAGKNLPIPSKYCFKLSVHSLCQVLVARILHRQPLEFHAVRSLLDKPLPGDTPYQRRRNR